MGLFQRLDNESQAAFVLCHELAHFFLNHSENSMRQHVAIINSKEVQQELRKIKNSEYNKREDLEKLLKGLSFTSSRHSRDHESEADSMAVEFMRKSKFNVQESLTALALLDSIDVDTLKTADLLQNMFDSKEYPFQKKWLKKEEGLLGGHAELKEDEPMADSLKTHPDCKLRINLLENLIKRSSTTSGTKDPVDKATFTSLKNAFQYEIIEYAFARENYTRSLYYTINALQNNPSDPYLVTQVGKIFNGLYNAQKNHKLGKVSALPSPYYTANYNVLLQFIQNLYKEDFASINYHFLQQFHPQLNSHAPFKIEYATSIQFAMQ